MRPLIGFDVNETLLDLGTMVPIFERIFGDPSAMHLWFANLIMYSEALTLSGVYVPFTDIGAAMLKMVAATRGVTITEETADELTQPIRLDATTRGGIWSVRSPHRPRLPTLHLD
jgi:2-haloacid dehalogenase